MAYLSQLTDLPEIVREARLNAQFHLGADQKVYIVHSRGRPSLGRQDIWVHAKNLGRGGCGFVDLQVRHSARPGRAQFRAVKSIAISEKELRSNSRFYVRELETILKFSQAAYDDLFVNTFGWYTSDTSLFITMEYLELGDLGKYLSSCPGGRVPEDETREIASQILDALSRMHDENFSHRDLKPQNVLIKSQPPEPWVVKLADFGISKRVIEAATTAQNTTIRGTPGFYAPELNDATLRSSEKLDLLASDMWCFGETIYRLLTGKPTFDNTRSLYHFVYAGGRFPDQALRDLQISEAAIAFLASFITPKPSERATAAEALSNPWLMDPSGLESSLSSLSLGGSTVLNLRPWGGVSTSGTEVSVGEITNEATASWPTVTIPAATESLGGSTLVNEATVIFGTENSHSATWPTTNTSSDLQETVDYTPDERSQEPDQILSPSAVPVFGVSLSALYERDGLTYPMVVYQCIRAVQTWGLTTGDIYRKSGSRTHIEKLKENFDDDPSTELQSRLNFHDNIHNVASLLKLFFKLLPDPLLTVERHAGLIFAAKKKDAVDRRDSIHAIINNLPDPNFAVIRILILHLYRIMSKSSANSMGSRELASVFGPILMRASIQKAIEDAPWQKTVVETLIENAYQIFDED